MRDQQILYNHNYMKYLIAFFLVAVLAHITGAPLQAVQAQSPEPAATVKPQNPALLTADLELFDPEDEEATEAAEATDSARLASPSAEVTERIREKTEDDITQPTETQKSRLAAFLDENPPGPLSWHNPLQLAIRGAIENGLPANIVVLILLFPVITMVIAASRHVIGLEGFGIYIPAVLSVAFVSTGLVNGIIAFGAILLAGMITRKGVKKLKMPYLPRTAMLLWGVSFITLLLLIAAAWLNLVTLLTLNIFPLLILMLLTENFMETQLFSSQKKAIRLTLETLLIASLCAFFIGQDSVQRFVIVHPEITLITVALINMAIGRFTGLRLLEYVRFRSMFER